MTNTRVHTIPAPKGTRDGFRKLWAKHTQSLKKERKKTASRDNGTTGKGGQTHLGWSVDTQGNGTAVKYTRNWMLKVVTPSNPNGIIVKHPNVNEIISQNIPFHEHANLKLKWVMVPYLRASISGNKWIYKDKTIRKVLLRFKKRLRKLDPACYSKMRMIPSSVAFPCKGSLFTGLSHTNLHALDPVKIGGHRDKKDEPGTKGLSYRINTDPGDDEGGLHVADGITSDKQLVGNIERLPIGKINIADFKNTAHAVYQPKVGESFGFNGYQNAAVLESAKMRDEGAHVFTAKEKEALIAQFDPTWSCIYCKQVIGTKQETRKHERRCPSKP